jgi:hypothetical protein
MVILGIISSALDKIREVVPSPPKVDIEIVFLRRRRRHRDEAGMWQERILFYSLPFSVLPPLAHKAWVSWREDQNPISRLRSLGAL